MERIYVYASHTIPGAVLSVQAPTERCASTVVCAMMGEQAATMGLVAIQAVREVLKASQAPAVSPVPPPGPASGPGTAALADGGAWADETAVGPWGWRAWRDRRGSVAGIPEGKAPGWEAFCFQQRWRMGNDGGGDGE